MSEMFHISEHAQKPPVYPRGIAGFRHSCHPHVKVVFDMIDFEGYRNELEKQREDISNFYRYDDKMSEFRDK